MSTLGHHLGSDRQAERQQTHDVERWSLRRPGEFPGISGGTQAQ